MSFAVDVGLVVRVYLHYQLDLVKKIPRQRRNQSLLVFAASSKRIGRIGEFVKIVAM